MSFIEKKDVKNMLGLIDSVSSEVTNNNFKGGFFNSVNPNQKKKQEEDEELFNQSHSEIEVNINTFKIKVVFVGDTNVGKTSIINRFCENIFEENGVKVTVSVAYKNKIIKTDPYTEINMDIWDTAGQEKYRSMTRGYLRDAYGIFLVFDLSQKKSFESLNSWLEEINNSDIKKKCVKILVGNKLDFEPKEVDRDAVNKFAEENRMKYMEVSAKNGINIDAMFEVIVTDCAKILQEETDENSKTYTLNKDKRNEELKASVLSAKDFNEDINKINKKSKKNFCC